MEQIPLTFYIEGSWEKSDNSSDEYRGGYIFLELVEASTTYEQLVEMLFDRMQRSPMEYKFSMKSELRRIRRDA